MGMATFWFGFQYPSSVTAADISAGIVIAMAYQKFQLGLVNKREGPTGVSEPTL